VLLVELAFRLTPDKEGLLRGIEWLFGWDEDPGDIQPDSMSLGGA